MFKRMNKITALLVAAAAIVSIVPATGVSAAERLGTKDGTIENAIAFKGGKYLYEGYKSDDDDKTIYYNDGNKDKQLEDIEDSDIQYTYGEKYVYLNDSGDEYLVDLSNGKVTDDVTPEDARENVITKLQSTLKKTDRYDQGTTVAAAEIGGIKFGETWFEYAASPFGDGKKDAVNTTINIGKNGKTKETGNFLFGYSNESGKYVDASKTANIYAYSYKKDKIIKITKFNDYDNDADLGVKLTGQPRVLTQDKDYIYAIVDVDITTSAGAFKGEQGTTGTAAKYVQKISKAQGEKKDGAYLPKSVDSYLLNDNNKDGYNVYDNGDVNDAYTAILKDDDEFLASNNAYRVKNGVLYVTRVKDGKVKVIKLKLTKIKESPVKGTSIFNDLDTDKDGKVNEKLDGYVVKKDGDSDNDLSDKMGWASVSIDVDGNTWAINQGKIYKFDGTDKKVMFTCDRSLDSLDVYDAGSLVAWEKDEDVYTTVQEGAAVTGTEAAPAQTGWVNTATGWTFYDAAGKQVVGSWINAGGVWYMIKADGIMATGWYNDNGTWYYLNASGAMQTGWFNDNGTWYYLQSSGAMKTGWLNDNGTWYYLQSNGAMAANTTVDGYVLNASGAWIK